VICILACTWDPTKQVYSNLWTRPKRTLLIHAHVLVMCSAHISFCNNITPSLKSRVLIKPIGLPCGLTDVSNSLCALTPTNSAPRGAPSCQWQQSCLQPLPRSGGQACDHHHLLAYVVPWHSVVYTHNLVTTIVWSHVDPYPFVFILSLIPPHCSISPLSSVPNFQLPL